MLLKRASNIGDVKDDAVAVKKSLDGGRIVVQSLTTSWQTAEVS